MDASLDKRFGKALETRGANSKQRELAQPELRKYMRTACVACSDFKTASEKHKGLVHVGVDCNALERIVVKIGDLPPGPAAAAKPRSHVTIVPKPGSITIVVEWESAMDNGTKSYKPPELTREEVLRHLFRVLENS
jgi:hypothetical protein